MEIRLISIAILTTFIGAPFSGSALADGPLKLHPGMMGVADIGAADCALFNEMHPNGPAGMEHHVLTWAEGYIYAKSGKTIDGVLEGLPADNGWDFDSLTGYIVDYCAANPDEKVAQAAAALWTTLSEGARAPR